MGEVWRKIKKTNDWALAVVLSLIHTGLSHFYSAKFFEYDINSEIAKRNKLLVGILFFAVMCLVYRGIIWLIKNRKKYKAYIKCGLVYFVVLMVVLALVWPGVWRCDDMETAMAAKRYMLDGWQHVLTSLLYMLSFRLLPVFVGVVVVQCAVIAIITSYIYNVISDYLKVNKVLYRVILWVPFVLLPVLDSAVYPLRPILYSYILVLTVIVMIGPVVKKKINKITIMLLAALFVLAISWRSEGAYMILVALIYWWYLAKERLIGYKWALMIFMLIMGGWWVLRNFENTALSAWHQSSYRVSATIEIAVPLARRAYMEEGNENELAAIDEVINIQYAVDHDDYSGEVVYWSEDGMRYDYTGDEVMKYMKAVVKLGLRYPDVVVKNRLKEFAVTSAIIDNSSNTIWDTTTNYDEGVVKKRILDFREYGGEWMLPWNVEIRKAVIRILEGRSIENYYDTVFIYPVFWNLIVPMVALVVFTTMMLMKRRWAIGLIIGSLLLKTGIVFVTAPGNYHMYYFAEYLMGYILLSVMIVGGIQKIRERYTRCSINGKKTSKKKGIK